MSVQVAQVAPGRPPLKRPPRALRQQQKRKRLSPGGVPADPPPPPGLYVHSSPPKVLQMNASQIRQWLRGGDLERLEAVVLEGQGHKLVGEYSPDPKVRAFLKTVPSYMAKMELLHEAAVRGQEDEMRSVLSEDPRGQRLALCKDTGGVGLMHKAVFHDHQPIIEWLAQEYPATLSLRDKEGRTPMHYVGRSSMPQHTWELLVEAGADPALLDSRGRDAAYYVQSPKELELPGGRSPTAPMRRFTSGKDGFVVTRANIRIWIHDRDFGRLQQMLWEGHGDKLRVETSNHPKVKRFLDAVPYIMGTIKDVHKSVIEDDEESLERRTADPIPPAVLVSKDQNGLTPLMKAAGLGRAGMVRSILERAPQSLEAVDGGGRRALHWAALHAARGGSDGDADICYQLLLEAGADETAKDTAGHEPSFYLHNPRALDASLLKVVPDAPRTSTIFPPAWDWRLLTTVDGDIFGSALREAGAVGDPLAGPEGEEASTAEGADGEDAGRDGEGDGAEAETEAERWEREEVPPPAEADPEILAVVAEGDLEKLAELVLAGQGNRLVGLTSEDPEVQAFLENVPTYLTKISAVHGASRDGRLRDLQANLDRRRFAVARDPSTPLRCTPLHAAVLHARVDVARYLGGRFPETLNAGDADERTPLHYAAALDDNGHLYNVLLNLGANPTLRDNRGRTADYYLQHRDRLSHKKLLAEYGSPESIADETFGDQVPGRMEPVFWTEEGRYLAAALGDPLIKGLMEIADKRPPDPIAYLAAYLYNFANKNKSRVNSQESAVLITGPPPGADLPPPQTDVQVEQMETYAQPPPPHHPPLQQDDMEESRPPSPDDADSSATRDEHGQSMLHFAAARPHGRGALLQLLLETRLNVGYRDELYRTARDVAAQAQLPENIRDIDRWVVYLAANGETQRLTELLLEGYDHLKDVEDDDGASILTVAEERKQHDTLELLESIPAFEDRRERLHAALRRGDTDEAAELLSRREGGAAMLAAAKNVYGRCSLHIAVLRQDPEAVELVATRFPHTLRVGDNLERTALHYAMGVERVEQLSAILIRAGAKRVLKDLKGRQPSYYFMNKVDILRLQDDEESLNV